MIDATAGERLQGRHRLARARIFTRSTNVCGLPMNSVSPNETRAAVQSCVADAWGADF